MDKKIEQESVLAVKGKDEANFFKALLEFLNISNVQIIDVGGKDSFKNKLSGYIQTDGALVKIKRIGFVRDAEKLEAELAFHSICTILQQYALPCPKELCKPIEQDGKRVSIFIMPNNNSCGMLEDLCIDSIKDAEIFTCIEHFIKCYIDKIEQDKFNTAKATILAYLSTRTPIVNSMGVAALQNVWDFTNPCFDETKRFLKELFEASS